MKLTATFALILPSMFYLGCNKEESTVPDSTVTPSTTTGGTSASGTTPASAGSASAAPEPYIPNEDQNPRHLVGGDMKAGEDVAILDTTAGQIVLRFFPKKAPKTVENFESLVKKGFYDGIKFHRTIPGFMIQGGDPNSKTGDPSTWGSGGPGYTIKDELNDVRHEYGILSMAKTSAPDTGGSQFFIMVGAAPHLNHVHTAFGEVVRGTTAVDKIVQTPTVDENGSVDPKSAAVIKSAKMAKWPLK